MVSSTLPVSSTVPAEAGAQMGITVDPTDENQEILGFGAAITDAVAEVWDSFSPALQRQLVDQFYGRANFAFARVPMNTADFSKMNYAHSYKTDLSDWCLRDDRTPAGQQAKCGDDYKLGPLKAALELQPELKVFVSTWSAAPAFKDQRFSCDVEAGMNACKPLLSGAPKVACNVSVADPSTCDSSNKTGVPCPTAPPTHIVPKVPLGGEGRHPGGARWRQLLEHRLHCRRGSSSNSSSRRRTRRRRNSSREHHHHHWLCGVGGALQTVHRRLPERVRARVGRDGVKRAKDDDRHVGV